MKPKSDATAFLTLRIAPREKAVLQRIAMYRRRTLTEEILYLIEKALGRPLKELAERVRDGE